MQQVVLIVLSVILCGCAADWLASGDESARYEKRSKVVDRVMSQEGDVSLSEVKDAGLSCQGAYYASKFEAFYRATRNKGSEFSPCKILYEGEKDLSR